MANEQTYVSRVADRGELPLLLDKARQFAGQYIESLEERPVFPREKIPASTACHSTSRFCPSMSLASRGSIHSLQPSSLYPCSALTPELTSPMFRHI